MSERIRERAQRLSMEDAMFGENRHQRNVYGTITTKNGWVGQIDDKRYVADGRVVEVIMAYSHEVVAIPTENVQNITEMPNWRSSSEVKFPRQSK